MGEKSDEGYSVTAPELIWTYDKEGIVEIERKTDGFWKKNTDEYDKAPDKGLYISGSDYYVTALSEGTVTAIGTPADNTNNVEPVKIKITVKQGTVESVETNKLVSQGTEGAIKFIKENHKDGYFYGDEWLVYSLLRAGETIKQDKLDAYYESVVEKVKTWSNSKKPTEIERVALALSIIGKDITNIEGINLAEMIYNSKRLQIGANELTYALIALDAKDTNIPKDALWSREKMISELLKFQNSKTGGFGLTDNKTTSVDITAMALQALAKYKGSNEDVDKAIENALKYLKSNMSKKYDFGTPESSAQVLLALTTLKIDPLSQNNGFGTNNRNIITRLMEYFDPKTGGFTRNLGDKNPMEMTTVQVLQALTSYQRYINREKSYWDLTNSKDDTGNNPGNGSEDKDDTGSNPGDGSEDKDDTGNNPGNGSEDKDDIGSNPGDGSEDKDDTGNNPGDGSEDKDDIGSNPGDGSEDKDDTGNNPGNDSTGKDDNVSTGDESIIIYVFIMVLSTLGLLVSFSRKYITKK